MLNPKCACSPPEGTGLIPVAYGPRVIEAQSCEEQEAELSRGLIKAPGRSSAPAPAFLQAVPRTGLSLTASQKATPAPGCLIQRLQEDGFQEVEAGV